jgi:hypothetical protein
MLHLEKRNRTILNLVPLGLGVYSSSVTRPLRMANLMSSARL